MAYKDKEKQNEFQKRWMKKRRDSWLGQNGPCKLCGSPDELEVHHSDPKSKVSHAIWSWTEARRLEELVKCVVLCHDCHRIETAKQRGLSWTPTHGTWNGYNYWRCRCADCRKAQADRIRKQKARKRLARTGFGPVFQP